MTQPDHFEAEFRCIEKASELVDKWNELGIVNKKYILIKPHMLRKSNMMMELLRLLTFGMALGLTSPRSAARKAIANSDVDSNENKLQVAENKNEQEKDDDGDGSELAVVSLLDVLLAEHIRKENEAAEENDKILVGELVIMEPYLNGEFTKWNSNGGWQNPDAIESSVQAFCHWSYHYSNEELLFCDAQGINRSDKYILTDPCIVSNKDFARDENGAIIDSNEQTYGVTDAGREFLLNWFRTHKCNKFCDKTWAKPTEIEVLNVPEAVKNASKVRSSVFNSATKGMGSITVGDSVLGANIIRQNYSLNGVDYARWPHIHKNEQVVKIGQMMVAVTETKLSKLKKDKDKPKENDKDTIVSVKKEDANKTGKEKGKGKKESNDKTDKKKGKGKKTGNNSKDKNSNSNKKKKGAEKEKLDKSSKGKRKESVDKTSKPIVKKENCVLILTNRNRLLIHWVDRKESKEDENDDDDDDDDEDDEDEEICTEIPQSKVKEVRLNQGFDNTFNVLVKKKKKKVQVFLFDCRDGKIGKDWKQDIEAAFDMKIKDED